MRSLEQDLLFLIAVRNCYDLTLLLNPDKFRRKFLIVLTIITDINGTKQWSINGKLHREDGPAIIRDNGTKKWYINDKLHREDGPALIWANGTQEWWINDKLHREDGPALIRADGTQEWWINGKYVDSF